MSTATSLPIQVTVLASAQPRYATSSDAASTGERNGAVGDGVPQEFASVLRASAPDSSSNNAAKDASMASAGNALLVAAMNRNTSTEEEDVRAIGPAWNNQELGDAPATNDAANQQLEKADGSAQIELLDSNVSEVGTPDPNTAVGTPDSLHDAPPGLGGVSVKERVRALYASQTQQVQEASSPTDVAASMMAGEGAAKSVDRSKDRSATHEEKGKTKTKTAAVADAVSQAASYDSLTYAGASHLPWASATGASEANRASEPQAIEGVAGASSLPASAAVPGSAAIVEGSASSAAVMQSGMPAVAPESNGSVPGQDGAGPAEQAEENDAVATKGKGTQVAGRPASVHAIGRAATKVADAATTDASAKRVDDATGSLLKTGNPIAGASPVGKTEQASAQSHATVSDRGDVVQAAASPDHGSAMRTEETGRRGQIEMRIDDAALGPVHVQATLDGSGGVRVGIAGQRDDAHAALEQIAPLLHAAVAQQVESHGSVTASLHVMTGAERGAESSGSGMFPTVRMGTGGAQVSQGDAFTGGFDGAAQQRPAQQNPADSSRQARAYRQQLEEGSSNGVSVPVALGFSTPASWSTTRSGGLSVRI